MRKPKLQPSSLIVTQSNKLVEARYNLPLGEQRLILTMIARIQPEDEDFKEYRIDVKEFSEFLGIDRNSVYREFHKIQKSIVSRVLVFYEDDGPLVVGWVSSAKYLKNEGAVLLTFDPKLKPYLLQLKGNFTSSKLDMLLSFKSQYTMRVYTLLKQYEALCVREIDLKLLREMLGIKDQYDLYSNFKNRILEPVKKELEQKSDIYFEYDEIKYGRSVGSIRFKIFTKKTNLHNKQDNNGSNHFLSPSTIEQNIGILSADLVALLPEQHRTKKSVLKAIEMYEKKYGFEYVNRNILYSNSKADKSYAGFLNNALKEDWGHDWQLEQQSVKQMPLEIWERHGFTSQKEYNDFMYRKQMEKYSKKG